jgi:hypothetical protein
MTTLTHTTELVVETCWCGLPHAIPRSLAEEANRTGKNVYCPLGHSYVFGQHGENAQLRKQVDDLKTRLTWARDDAAYQREAADRARRSASARKGQLTKAFNRLRAGVCPLCRRNFPSLGEHMRHEHPTAVADLETEPTEVQA